MCHYPKKKNSTEKPIGFLKPLLVARCPLGTYLGVDFITGFLISKDWNGSATLRFY
jgi:hypothetical protein